MTPYHVRHAKLWERLQSEQAKRDSGRSPELVAELARKTDEHYALLIPGGPFPQELPAGGMKLHMPPRTAEQFDFSMACQVLFYEQKTEALNEAAATFDSEHAGRPNNAAAQAALSRLLLNHLKLGDEA